MLGGSLGLAQDFRGPQAKPHRMALLTLACLATALEGVYHGSQYSMVVALCVLVVGTLWTSVARTRAIAQSLNERAQ